MRSRSGRLQGSSRDPGSAAADPGSAHENWATAVRRSFKAFLDDDAMGLSAQIAFSSLLAFFPAVVFLVGLLDLAGAYDALRDFLAPLSGLPSTTKQIYASTPSSSGGPPHDLGGCYLALQQHAPQRNNASWVCRPIRLSAVPGFAVQHSSRSACRVECLSAQWLRSMALKVSTLGTCL